jgi:hypothetical protein
MHDQGGMQEDGEDIFRGMSRRKSSAASEVAPPLPKRRSRQPSLHQRRVSQHVQGQEEGGEALLVVEAPVGEGSGESSPVKGSVDANEQGMT